MDYKAWFDKQSKEVQALVMAEHEGLHSALQKNGRMGGGQK